MMKNNKHYIHHIIDKKIKYDVEKTKRLYSMVLFSVLFVEFSMYAVLSKLVVSNFICANYQDVVNVILYVLLYLLICLTAFVVKYFAQQENGGKNPFAEKELGKIALKSLVLTGIFYCTFSEKELSSPSLPFVGVLAGLLVGFIFSLDEGLDQDDISGLINYLKQSVIDLLRSFLDRFSITIFISILLSVWFDLLIDKQLVLCLIILGSLYALIVILFFLFELSYFLIIKRIKRKAIHQNVLILEYTPKRVLLSKIIKRLPKTGVEYERIRKAQMYANRYDVILIVDALTNQTKLLRDAQSCLAEDGVIIAPAYTSHRKKTKLISEKEYVEKLKKQGWIISEVSSYRLIGVTYVELKKLRKDSISNG